MTRYRVIRDNQGGEFGMNRDLTLAEWRKQALSWCWLDGNYELGKYFLKLPKNRLLGEISEIWDIVFRKVRKDKRTYVKEQFYTIKQFRELFKGEE